MRKVKFFLSIFVFLFLFITAGTLVKGYISNDEFELTIKAYYDDDQYVDDDIFVTYGTKVTFENVFSDVLEGYRFVLWTVNDIARTDISETNPEFVITYNMDIAAIYSPDEKYAVVFRDSNGKVLDVQYVLPNGSATKPSTVTSKPGLTNPKWDKDFSKITKDTIVTLQYELENPEQSFKLDAFDAIIKDTNNVEGWYPYNSIATVEPDPEIEAEGKAFSHWMSEDGKILSYSRTYSFTMLEGLIITATYEGDVEKHPLITLTNNLNLREDYNTYKGQFYLPNGYELIEKGLITHSTEVSFDLDTEGVMIRKSNTHQPVTNEFLMSLNPEDLLAVRAYMVVRDDKGNLETIYSDIVVEDITAPISAARSAAVNDTVIAKGVVTSRIGNNAFIQDETAGIYLYLSNNSSYNAQLAVGNEVVVYGTRAVYEGLVQISGITKVLVLRTNQALPNAVEIDTENSDLTELSALEGQLVSIYGLTIKSIPTIGTSSFNVVVTNGTNDFQIRVDESVADFAGIKSLFQKAVVDQTINLTNVPVGRFNVNVQVMLSSGDQLEITYTNNQIESIIENEIEPVSSTDKDIELVTSVTIDKTDYTITWTSSNPDVITNEGLVTPQSDNVDVTLTATFYIKGNMITKNFIVTVIGENVEIRELFFSEYGEGSSFNKWLEIYNPTASTVDLSSYKVELYANGSQTATKFLELKGLLAPGAVIVIINGGLDEAVKKPEYIESSDVANFNGDDAVALLKNEKVIDVIGTIGDDPGDEWEYDDLSTKDKTLVRKFGILSPNKSFTPEEWDVKPIDDFSYMGFHIAETIVPDSITIDGPTEVMSGKQIQLTAIVLPLGSSQNVIWSSNNEEVATVDANGKVTALSEGELIITVSSIDYPNITESYLITVIPVPVDEILDAIEVAIKPSEVILDNFDLITFVTIYNKDYVISWVSNNSAIIINGSNAEVTRPGAEDSDIEVKLVATVEINGVNREITFDVIVKAESEVELVLKYHFTNASGSTGYTTSQKMENIVTNQEVTLSGNRISVQNLQSWQNIKSITLAGQKDNDAYITFDLGADVASKVEFDAAGWTTSQVVTGLTLEVWNGSSWTAVSTSVHNEIEIHNYKTFTFEITGSKFRIVAKSTKTDNNGKVCIDNIKFYV